MTSPARLRRRTVTLGALGAVALFAAGCTGATEPTAAADETPIEDLDPAALHWVAPLATDTVAADEPLEVAVYTQSAQAHAVRFAVDGREVGVCDPAQPDEDCHADNNWFYTVALTAGRHTLSASFSDDQGHAVQTARTVDVVAHAAEPANPPDLEPDDDITLTGDSDETADGEEGEAYPAPDPDLPEVLEGEGTVVQALDVHYDHARGYLDPAHALRSFHGGTSYRVHSQYVRLANGRIDGSSSSVCSCFRYNYGTVLQYTGEDVGHGGTRVSRATLVAALAADNHCGARQGIAPSGVLIRGRQCSAIAHIAHVDIPGGDSDATCRARLNDTPAFALHLVAAYLSMNSVAAKHQYDPPRMAAVLSAGSVRASHQNHWHMLAQDGFIDRFVAAYNAYRTQESGGLPDYPAAYNFMDGRYNHKLRAEGGNRIVNPDSTGIGTARQYWPVVHPNDPMHPISVLDGMGTERGVLVSSSVQVNYGQRRMIHGEPYVYAFAVTIRPTDGQHDGDYTASSWIPESEVQGAALHAMPTVTPTPAASTDHVYRIVGAPLDRDYLPMSSPRYVTPEPMFGFNDYRVLKVFTGVHGEANDYYIRTGNVVYLLFSLAGRGGVATDTFKVSTPGHDVLFHEAADVPRVDMPLYQPCSATSDRAQTYRYGYVDTPDGHRWGWMADANLTLVQ